MAKIEMLRLWSSAEKCWDEGDRCQAKEYFSSIAEPTARILFNIGRAEVELGHLIDAEKSFTSAIMRDQHLALAYWQRGIVKCKLKKFQEALNDFGQCQPLLRGNVYIDYSKLDLRYKLYDCEIQHNCAVCHINLNDKHSAEHCLQLAQGNIIEKRHRLIPASLQHLQEGGDASKFELFEMPSDAIFRADKSKVRHIDKRADYIEKAKVVSSVCENDTFAGFSGPLQVIEMAKQKSLSAPSSPSQERKEEKAQHQVPLSKSPILNSILNGNRKLMRSMPPPQRPVPRPSLQEVVEWNMDREVLSGESGPDKHSTSSDTNPGLPGMSVASLTKALEPVTGGRITGSRVTGGRVTDDQRERGSVPDITVTGPGGQPKLRKDQTSPVQTPAAGSVDLNRPPSRPLPRPSGKDKPLPAEPTQATQLVNVDFFCSSHLQQWPVLLGTSMDVMLEIAGNLHDLHDFAFDLWYKRTSDYSLICIQTNEDMQEAWKNIVNHSLTVWCYSKS